MKVELEPLTASILQALCKFYLDSSSSHGWMQVRTLEQKPIGSIKLSVLKACGGLEVVLYDSRFLFSTG